MSAHVGFAFKPTVTCFSWRFLGLLIAVCLAASSVLGHDDVGETTPHHVEIPIGGSANITCRMNISRFNENNSSCLAFSRDYSNATIPKEHIHIINETSIVYMIRNATEQSTRYVCKCYKSGVDVTRVDVGTPPTNVTDFRCRGYDFSYVTCNFTVPENKIFTKYKLKFTTSSPDYTNECDLDNGVLPNERICNITMDDKKYRIVHQFYTFRLIAMNAIGTLTQTMRIDHHSIMIPAKPEVKIGNITANSVELSWIIYKYSHYNSNTYGLFYEIRLRPEKFDWIDIDTRVVVRNNTKDYWAEIMNLEYPYRRYDLIVRAKAVKSIDDETMWSEPFHGQFMTKPRRPDNPPLMDVGSFYIDPTEKSIRLYWQQLPEYRENGPDFQYIVSEIIKDGNTINIAPVHFDHTSVTYEWYSQSNYEFKVKSQNQKGQSLESSILRVTPNRERSIQLEQTITKVYHNQTYTVSWWKPTDMENLMNFTVFWCISKMESQSQCKGTINFKHFDKFTHNYTTEPQNHTLNFAVSANYRTYSTGMIWAMCTADIATDLAKMDPETSPISSNSIKVQWSTECLYTAILEGYNLTYCKVGDNASETIGDCIGSERIIIISKLAKEYIITDLEPFTTYKILIFMYSKVKASPPSNPVYAKTTEDAPTPPRKLRYQNVTSNSVVISWFPPKQSNGNLRFYTIWQNNDQHIVNSTTNDTDTEITFTLENLSSFSDYKVYLTAHTVKSSAPSNDIHIKTLIGIPSTPHALNITKGDNSLVLRWARPIVPSGRVEFYEIRVNVIKNNQTIPSKISRVVGNVCQINLPPCYDRDYTYNFHVRAVNVADKNEVDYHTFPKRDTSLFSASHQGAAKRRRHSNAEINSSVGGTYLIHDSTERHLRHRHERENLKALSTYTTQSPKVYEPIIDSYDSSNEDLMCVDGDHSSAQLLRRFNDTRQFEFFYSGWQSGPYYACGEAKFSTMTLFALVSIPIVLLMVSAGCWFRKTYNKMSNIGVVIPPGLDENIHPPKGVDNTIEHDETSRSDEMLCEKEDHRLLSNTGSESFLNSVPCLDKNSTYICADHQDSEKSSQSTDSVELNDITSCSYTSSPSHSPNANVRESAGTEEKFTPAVIQPTSVQLRPSDNGYIKPMMMTNGYVQPQAFQKLQTRDSPYTRLDAMGKLMFPPISAATAAPVGDSFGVADSKTVSNKDNAIPQPMNGNICGYVTHKQLSDYGQRLQ